MIKGGYTTKTPIQEIKEEIKNIKYDIQSIKNDIQIIKLLIKPVQQPKNTTPIETEGGGWFFF